MITHQHEGGNTANAFKCEFPFQANHAWSDSSFAPEFGVA